MKQTGWIVLGVIVLVGLMLIGWFVGSYNRIVTADEAIGAQWAQVETVLQRRYDLVPNLVETVKGYATHEKELFETVAAVRSQWAGAQTQAAKVEAATAMESALARLMVVVENYPDLKANQNFLALQDELAGTENRISVERRRYNDAVRVYNTIIRRFPASIVAGMRGFERNEAYFEAASEAKAAPQVKF